jgi:hypothetical protein
MKDSKKSSDNLDDHSKRILFIVGAVTLFLLFVWMYTLWSRRGDLPWYIDLLSGGASSFLFAFIIMIFQNRFQQRLYARDAFFKSLKKHGIKDMHHEKKTVLSPWIRNARKEVCMTGYRQFLTLAVLDDLIYALDNSKELCVKILACPPWTDTYKKIFDDDTSINYITLLKKLKDKVPDFKRRISIRFTEKPLFNDTYIIDHYLITSPYVHNRSKASVTPGVITADKFFSLEIDDDSSLYHFFKEDFMAVWESNLTKALDDDFELFNSSEVEEKLIKNKRAL